MERMKKKLCSLGIDRKVTIHSNIYRNGEKANNAL